MQVINHRKVMKSFKSDLELSIKENYNNYFGKENYDEHRFGKYPPKKIVFRIRLARIIKYFAARFIRFNSNPFIQSFLKNYGNGLQLLWENLNETDKGLLIKLIVFRLLGYRTIKLPTNNPFYWEKLESLSEYIDKNDYYDPNFMHFILYKVDLNKLGFDIKFYHTKIGVLNDFILEQYAYKNDGEKIVYAEKDDIVIDCGGCWGDTALYFANSVGVNGKVYCFEFIPNNIKILNINVQLNKILSEIIELIPSPVSDKSDVNIYFKDNGPASKIKEVSFEGQTGQVKTITIDDFVSRNSINKVNFIKMDIEGTEPFALKGAEKTIRKFRPKLAIAIYHSMGDFINIPKWILELNLDYEIYLGHYTIHSEETIIFAKPRIK